MEKNINIVEYNSKLTNFTLIDGLTPDIIKRKYIWLLNAIVKNVIIGQDSYGLVWYSGTWFSGEWEDGTWYSGIWMDGEWKNGNFYSYRYDTKHLLQGNKRILESENPSYSQFRSGIWRSGNFYNGYFGTERFNEGWELMSDIEISYFYTRWENGLFYNGIFRNATWHNGLFYNGIFYNGEWINGTFLNGTFQGYEWWNGTFNGGDFILGDWWNGKFNQSNSNIKSRFGSIPLNKKSTAENTTTWHNGEFINGEFHSGLNIISGVSFISTDHRKSIWENGTWYNGIWYGGTFIGGNFNNGYWLEGIFLDNAIFNNGYWYNGFCSGATINGGNFIQGKFIDIIFNGGKLGYEPLNNLLDSLLSYRENSINPKFLGFTPSVITDIPTNISISGATCGGTVVTDGGSSVTERGICWSLQEYPNLTDEHSYDGNGLGGFVRYINLNSTYSYTYYIRAYATNAAGTTYGNQVIFST
jgi:hypothetical protein